MEFTCVYELSHHGIKGQRWGVKNGPPYPLDPSDKSKSEKKAEEKERRSGINKKKAIKIGGALVGTALLTAGAIYMAKSGKLDNLVKIGHNSVSDVVFSGNNKQELYDHFGKSEQLGFSDELLSSVGSANTLQHDCGPSAIALLENANTGLKLKAKDVPAGMTIKDIETLYPTTKHGVAMGIKDIDNPTPLAMNKYLNSHTQENGNGILGLVSKDTSKNSGHFITYSKENGKIVFRDPTVTNGKIKGLKFTLDPPTMTAGGKTVGGEKVKAYLDSMLETRYNLQTPFFIPISGHDIVNDISLLDEYFESL